MHHSIICGVDGSPSSRSAARVASRLARKLNIRFVLAHATEDRPTFPYRDTRLREIQRRRAIDAGQRLLDDVAADLPEAAPETRVTLGPPVEALSALCSAEAAELLVVGSRGRGPVAAAVLGSVSARVATVAECPVVVVPTAAAERYLEPGTPAGVSSVDGFPESASALRADGDRERVGRFSEGIEQYPDSPSKLRRGRFSDGIEQLPDTPGKLQRGRFSEGIEQLPQTGMKLRRGSFADGCEARTAGSSHTSV
jgi:nucleotide-binding universal stress UspA family protein